MTRIDAPRPAAARLLPVSLIGLLLAGCSSIGGWFGESDAPPLPGERISVLQLERKVEPDPRLGDVEVALPAPTRNAAWPGAGGHPDHALSHAALSGAVREVWRADIGSGADSTRRLLTPPVVADGKLFAMDAATSVTALDAGTGRRLWQADLRPEKEGGEALGGGVAFADGRLFASTGYGEVIALEPASGAVVWRKRVGGPVRGAPTVLNGRVYAITLDNQAHALAVADGASLWTHTGILESAGLLGATSAAANAALVVVPYTSGELVGVRPENGRVVWSENLAAIRRVGALSGLADIRGLPVMDRGVVLAVSHSGRTVAIDERTGARIWEQEVGGVNTPWAAGDFVFLLSNDSEIMAMTRRSGRVRWSVALDRYRDPKDREGVIVWHGPVLAGNRLWLTNSLGQLVDVSPATGAVQTRRPLSGAAVSPPVVAEDSLYVLTEGGVVIAFR